MGLLVAILAFLFNAKPKLLETIVNTIIVILLSFVITAFVAGLASRFGRTGLWQLAHIRDGVDHARISSSQYRKMCPAQVTTLKCSAR